MNMVNICVPDFTESTKGVVRELRNNRKSYFKIWLPEVAFNCPNNSMRTWKDVGQIEKGIKIDWQNNCFQWNIESYGVISREDVYRYCVERALKGGCWIVLADEKVEKGHYSFFIDKKGDPNLPDEWINLQCFDNAQEILVFCLNVANAHKSLSQDPNFEVGHDEFKHTRGAQVYKDKKTGNYWYIDTFHTDHFEVFDKFGKNHLGISEIDKHELIPDTADPKKKPIL